MSMIRPTCLWLGCTALAVTYAFAGSVAADDFQAPRTPPGSWLDRLPADDRGPLEGWVGYLPPAFPSDVRQVPATEGSDLSWSDFYGKVVVVQSWSVASADSARRLNEVVQVVDQFSELDVHLIALHTPDRADDAARMIPPHERHQVLIDPSGEFCDLLGIYRRPVNLVIGPNGAVRYVGLTADGVLEAINALLDEDPANAICSGTRPIGHVTDGTETQAGGPSFPPIRGEVRGNDLRGQQAPAFHVSSWITPEPSSLTGKPMLVVFWRTTCPACVRAVPHKNELVEQFGDRLNIVAISMEQQEAFEQSLSARGLSKGGFKYHVALDPGRRMQNAFRPTHVPTAAFIDSNWVVRWQGNPIQLNASFLEQLLLADEGGGGSAPVLSTRWRSTTQDDGQEARRQRVERVRQSRASGFPPITGDTSPAVDFRGKTGPDFHAGTWITPSPENLGDNVTVVEFWRTGCPHCIRAIPHKNDLASHFGDRVNIIGISSDTPEVFEQGLVRQNLSKDSFKYFVSLDPTRKLMSAVGPRGVPYAMVFGSDWTVRWQGHPTQLTVDLLDQIVRADEATRVAGPTPR